MYRDRRYTETESGNARKTIQILSYLNVFINDAGDEVELSVRRMLVYGRYVYF